MTHEAYDPLDARQWERYFLPRQTLARLDQSAISLATVRAEADRVQLTDLAEAVRSAATACTVQQPVAASGSAEEVFNTST